MRAPGRFGRTFPFLPPTSEETFLYVSSILDNLRWCRERRGQADAIRRAADREEARWLRRLERICGAIRPVGAADDDDDDEEDCEDVMDDTVAGELSTEASAQSDDDDFIDDEEDSDDTDDDGDDDGDSRRQWRMHGGRFRMLFYISNDADEMYSEYIAACRQARREPATRKQWDAIIRRSKK